MSRHNISLPDEQSDFVEQNGLSLSKILQNEIKDRMKEKKIVDQKMDEIVEELDLDNTIITDIVLGKRIKEKTREFEEEEEFSDSEDSKERMVRILDEVKKELRSEMS